MRLPVFRWDDTRPTTIRFRRLLTQTGALLDIPPEVRTFYIRALWTAWRERDQYSFDVVTRPDDLRQILRLAGDAEVTVELGTATAWTTIALSHLRLVSPDVRERITLVRGPGRSGPQSGEPVDFLFVDGSHEREDTITTFKVWQEIAPKGRIVFHDYLDPGNPGVTEAIATLQLDGHRRGRMFVWTQDSQQHAHNARRRAP